MGCLVFGSSRRGDLMDAERLASRLRHGDGCAGEHVPGSAVRYEDTLSEAADEIERLRAENRRLAGLLANVVCPNCGDRACMDCCGRYEHDECEDDCPVCCEDQPRLTVTGYPLNAWRARRAWLLEGGV